MEAALVRRKGKFGLGCHNRKLVQIEQLRKLGNWLLYRIQLYYLYYKMKTVTIRTNNDESTEQLTALLRSLDFVESVEVYDDSDDLIPEELSMVQERIEKYRRDPSKVRKWEDVKAELESKYSV